MKVRRKGERYIIRKHYIEAKNDDVARQKARKYGQPISAYKLESSTASIEKLPLNNLVPPPTISPAIAMDEMIWRKRNIRRENTYRDKPEDFT